MSHICKGTFMKNGTDEKQRNVLEHYRLTGLYRGASQSSKV